MPKVAQAIQRNFVSASLKIFYIIAGKIHSNEIFAKVQNLRLVTLNEIFVKVQFLRLVTIANFNFIALDGLCGIKFRKN